MTASNRRKPTAEEAKNLYLSMGSERSLRALQQALDKSDTLRAPSWNTLSKWCREQEWVERAAEYDAQVAARVHEKALETQAEHQWDAARSFREAARACIAKANSNIDAVPVETPQHFQQLITSAIDLVKAAEVLDGGVSDRTVDQRSMPGVDDLEDYLAELDALAAADTPTKH